MSRIMAIIGGKVPGESTARVLFREHWRRYLPAGNRFLPRRSCYGLVHWDKLHYVVIYVEGYPFYRFAGWKFADEHDAQRWVSFGNAMFGILPGDVEAIMTSVAEAQSKQPTKIIQTDPLNIFSTKQSQS